MPGTWLVARKRKTAPRAAAAGHKAVKSRRPGADTSQDVILGGMGLADIRRLIRLVQRTGIGELEISFGGRTVRISAGGASYALAGGSVPGTMSLERPVQPPVTSGTGAAPAAESHVAITSPMVGTFFRAPAPDADPYAEVGATVEIGQTVCIIEAMKLMNEIESEVRGKIVKILVENAQPVEFGQRLFLVEPI